VKRGEWVRYVAAIGSMLALLISLLAGVGWSGMSLNIAVFSVYGWIIGWLISWLEELNNNKESLYWTGEHDQVL